MRSPLDEETLQASERISHVEVPDVMPALTILYHRDPRRVGEVARLTALLHGGSESLSRVGPTFCAPGESAGRALADRFVSRNPVTLTQTGGDLTLTASAEGSAVTVDGAPLRGSVRVPAAHLEDGVVLELGAHGVVLLLHLVPPVLNVLPPRLGLVGDNPAMERLRREVTRVAGLTVSALIQGETGTGKELVARALHDASPRRGQPCVCVNMATLPETLAASELFGHVKGAFSGATHDHQGYFARAHGGTLFLDEIGETPHAVQGMLLRALETGEIQPLGANKPQRVDMRVLAATDAKLDQAIADDRFSEALLHRLAGYPLELPPLRARRDDIARLLFHFLDRELGALGRASLLTPPETQSRPWLSPALVAKLVRYDWPGNVRQLRNVAQQIVAASHDARTAALPAVFERAVALVGRPAVETEEPAATSQPSGAPRRRRAAEITDEELVEALRANGWKRDPAADQLGIGRSTFYERMDRCPLVPKASEIPLDEIRRVWSVCGGDLERTSEHLRVSLKALKLRLKGVDLEWKGASSADLPQEKRS